MNAEKKRTGYIEGSLSALLNAGLFALKLVVGSSAGSVAMVADAWHTLSDTATSLVVVFGFWISSRPRDEEHPFGHGRAEPIAGIVIGVLLATVGVRFLGESITQLRTHAVAAFDLRSIIVFGVATLLKEAIAQYSIRAGRRVGSSALVADGWTHGGAQGARGNS